MNQYFKCNHCGNIFLVDDDEIQRYKSQLSYADQLHLQALNAEMQGMYNIATTKLSESEMIRNSAMDPRKCPSCASSNSHRMSSSEIQTYKKSIADAEAEQARQLKKQIEQINEEKKAAALKAEIKEKRDKAFATPINPNATVEQLKERILSFMDDEDWFMAEHYIEHTLDIASDDYYLYYLKFLTLNNCKSNADLRKKSIAFDEKDSVCSKIIKFADEGFKQQMAEHNLNVTVDEVCNMPNEKAKEFYDLCEKLINEYNLTETSNLGKKLYKKRIKLLESKQGDIKTRFNLILSLYKNKKKDIYENLLIEIYLEGLVEFIRNSKQTVLDSFIGNDELYNEIIIEKQNEIVDKLKGLYNIDKTFISEKSSDRLLNNFLEHLNNIISKNSSKTNGYNAFKNQILNELETYFDFEVDRIVSSSMYSNDKVKEYNSLTERISEYEKKYKEETSFSSKLKEIKNKCEKYADEETAREKEQRQRESEERQRKQEEEQRIQDEKKKKLKKFSIMGAGIVIAFIIISTVTTKIIVPSQKYNKAMSLIESGDYKQAYVLLKELKNKDSENILSSLLQQYPGFSLFEAEVGSYVNFGSYEQDNNISNGKENIEWQVLAKEDNRVLLISKYILGFELYNTSKMDVTWETCTLRKWLNKDFANIAFTPEEIKSINVSTVTADKNPKYNTSPGNDTSDKIFLLSAKEANQYFNSNESRKCRATKYAIAPEEYDVYSTSYWKLRTPGNYKFFVATVSYNGYIDNDGFNVNDENTGVRPAIWVNIGNVN